MRWDEVVDAAISRSLKETQCAKKDGHSSSSDDRMEDGQHLSYRSYRHLPPPLHQVFQDTVALRVHPMERCWRENTDNDDSISSIETRDASDRRMEDTDVHDAADLFRGVGRRQRG